MRRVVVLVLLMAAGSGALIAQDKKLTPHRIARVTKDNVKLAAEATVAINPTNIDHIIGASQQGPSNVAYASTDGGKTWQTAVLPNPRKRIQGDDVVLFNADGLAIHTCISFTGIRIARPTRAATGIFVSTSKTGLEWSEPAAVVDHVNTVHPFEDKPWLAVDRVPKSPHKGNIYVAWTKFDEYGSKDPKHLSHIYLARSKDNGKTFSVPHRISQTPGDCVDSSETVEGAVPAVGPRGEVYVAWAGPKGLVFVKSTDGGFTFGKEKFLGETPGGWNYSIKGLGRCNGLPITAVDQSDGPNRGSIYINWTDLRNGDPDSFLIASRDGGETWSKPMRVNDDPKGNGKEQFFTWMAVDPRDGSVNIAFYDRRDTEGTKIGLTLARSVDGGKTFVNHKIDQAPFAPVKGLFFGDYLGIDAFGGRVVVMYQHYPDQKSLAVSAAVFDFKLTSQETR
jgi:hypothetical protein